MNKAHMLTKNIKTPTEREKRKQMKATTNACGCGSDKGKFIR